MAKRKTFKKKSTAKTARKKGQSVYKVKGGYRLSKKKRRGGVIVQTLLLLMAVALFVAFMAVSGCTPAQLLQTDEVVGNVKSASAAAATAIQEGGALIPEPYRSGSVLGLGLLGYLAAGWQSWRKSAYKGALSDVVTGVERYKLSSDPLDAVGLKELKHQQDVIQTPQTRKLVKKMRSAA